MFIYFDFVIRTLTFHGLYIDVESRKKITWTGSIAAVKNKNSYVVFIRKNNATTSDLCHQHRQDIFVQMKTFIHQI